MSVFYGVAVIAALLVGSAALADGIEPGLWKVTTRTAGGGEISAPHESAKCLTADQTDNLAVTFSPVATTINSECAPMERNLAGPLLTWHLVCKGQLDMELTGNFNFDSPHHYTGTVQTRAVLQGMPPVESQNTLEGQWVSPCPR